ncbi:methyltransferase domain-containing protein [Actinokineospora iranica]|uniref:Methyltransferase domain-containing protein n=1 Tax=Actinokineospora iranica TaxID=1271860 RepID=A0A1G6JXG1_9PSEU|nr:methyltransferase domain-containing protein [Actinokineospora iranica]SDC22716.1 Methyltransferase domain-containing protein [Actinokineospora iranica]
MSENQALHDLGSLIDLARSRRVDVWEPWLAREEDDGRTRAHALLRLLHHGESVPAASVDGATVLSLVQAGVCEVNGALLTPARFRVTAFRGLVVAADRDYGTGGDDVHVGNDSLRYTAAVLNAAPRGRVLDIGCGSGIAMLAAARTADEVLGVDILDSAMAATRASVALTGPAVGCQAMPGKFQDLDIDGIDCVTANLPGVPVPPGLAYPAAGAAGADGLDLIRAFWEWFAARSSARRLVMRFQSLGSAAAPSALRELDHILPSGADVTVVTDSSVPVVVRNAITAVRAAQLNPGRTLSEVLGLLQRECLDRGENYYHCSTLYVTRAGSGARNHLPCGVDHKPDSRYRAGTETISDAGVMLAAANRLREMPDEFWSVDGERTMKLLADDLAEVRAELRSGTSPAELAEKMGGPESPLRQAALCLAVSLVASVLRERNVLELRDDEPTASAGFGSVWKSVRKP